LSQEQHRRAAPAQVRVLIVTLSDTRLPSTDTSGETLRAALGAAGHSVTGPRIVRENPERLLEELRALVMTPDIDAVIVSGGTGIAPRDGTYEALADLYTRPLPGFGELFRALSYAEIGSAAILSRASAGVVGDTLVFSVPGSQAAVRLALDKLILPELGHMVGELRRNPGPEAPS